MTEYFPEEKKAIDQYVTLIFEAIKTSRNFYASKALSKFMLGLVGGKMRKPFYKFSDKTTYEVLKSITDNEELIKVLCGQYGDYGLPPKQSSFVMHASVVRHHFSGGSFTVGGSSEIAKTTDKVIEKAGGTIVIKAEVEEIVIERNKAKGVLLKDGKIVTAKNIVSGAGIMNTYEKLLPDTLSIKGQLNEQLKKVNRSVAHACLYIGLRGSPQALDLPKTNYWIYPEDLDHDACVERYLKDIHTEFPVVYISFLSAKDPDWNRRYPEKSTIDIITLVPLRTFSKLGRNSLDDEVLRNLQ